MKYQIDHPPVRAFVAEREATCRELKTTVTIVCGEKRIEGVAQWDTGASGSCISQRVVQELEPVRTGLRTVLTPTGSSIRGMYLLDLVLPNEVHVPDVAVVDTEIGNQGVDVLIGMDIISLGDFAVSNYDSKLVFTFRVPSIKTTNYVAEVQAENTRARIQSHGKGTTRKRHK